MALTGLLNPQETTGNFQPIKGLPSSGGELFLLNRRDVAENWNFAAKHAVINDEARKNLTNAQSLLGRPIKPEDASNYTPYQYENIPATTVFAVRRQHDELDRQKHDLNYIYEAIDELKTKDPEKYKTLKTREEVLRTAQDRALASKRTFAEAKERSPGIWKSIASFAGAIAGGLQDPLNLAFGLGSGGAGLVGRLGARAILKTALREAAINAGAEAISQPFVAQWQRELGQDYGFSEALQSVGFAAILGGSFSLAGSGIKAGVYVARPAASDFFLRLSKSNKLSSKARTAASYLARKIQIDENNPYVRNPRIDQARDHIHNLNVGIDALSRGERINTPDLLLNEQAFMAIDSLPKRGDTQIMLTRLAELRRYQEELGPAGLPSPKFTRATLPQQILEKAVKQAGKVSRAIFTPEELSILKSANILPNKKGLFDQAIFRKELSLRKKRGRLVSLAGRDREHVIEFRQLTSGEGAPQPKYTNETLPQQVLQKASRKKGALTSKDFAAQELDMLKGAGITPNKRGNIPKQPLTRELARRQRRGELRDLPEGDTTHIDDFNNRVLGGGISSEDANLHAVNIAQVIRAAEKANIDDNLISHSPQVRTETPVVEAASEKADFGVEGSANEARIAAEENTFKVLVEEAPETLVTLEDGRQVSVKQLLEEVAEDERILKEISTCAVG